MKNIPISNEAKIILTDLKIIGAAEATANLLCEFNIAAKKEAILINNKKENVILVKYIAKSILSLSSTKPGNYRHKYRHKNFNYKN